MYRLSNSFPYLLNRVGVRMGELFSRRIASYDVTLPMYRVMAALWENGDQRLSDLSTVTTTEISTLSRLIGDMKRRGLVSRSRLEDNGRTVAINLTAKGKLRRSFRRGCGIKLFGGRDLASQDRVPRDLSKPGIDRARDRSDQGHRETKTKIAAEPAAIKATREGISGGPEGLVSHAMLQRRQQESGIPCRII